MNSEEGEVSKAAQAFLIIDIVFYLAMLVAAIYIIARFLVWQDKGKILYVTAFYVFACITLVARIVFFVTKSSWAYGISDRIAFTSKVLLELFQIAQMVELSIQVKVSAFNLNLNDAKK